MSLPTSIRKSIWLAVLMSVICIEVTESAGRLSIQFLQYSSGGRIADGNRCGGTGECNPQFQVQIYRDKEGHQLIYSYYQNGFYYRQNTVYFDSKLGRESNPFFAHLNNSENQNDVWMDVIVRDLVPGKKTELMSQFRIHLTLSGPDVKNVQLKNALNQSFMIRYWFRCDKNYFGPLCNRLCVEHNDDQNGHYGCDENGNLVCRLGWIDPSTQCKQQHLCRTCICQNGGVCVPQGYASYKCLCDAGFYGNNCQDCYPGVSCQASQAEASCDPLAPTKVPTPDGIVISVRALVGTISGAIGFGMILVGTIWSFCCCRSSS